MKLISMASEMAKLYIRDSVKDFKQYGYRFCVEGVLLWILLGLVYVKCLVPLVSPLMSQGIIASIISVIMMIVGAIVFIISGMELASICCWFWDQIKKGSED